MLFDLEQLKTRDDYLILAIESSCDETACAVVRGREVLSDVIATQIDIHKEYGGVVPEIASRNHTVNIESVVAEALKKAGVTLSDISAIAVTYGAGLQGALLVGIAYAKGLAYALGLPLVGVNHIHGHISANYITHKDLEPPYLCLICSGGNTGVALVKDYEDITLLGQTEDDAAGEAFDKVARVLNLEYPGGPKIQKLAAEGKPTVQMPHPLSGQKGYDFSYSGLKTAVINYVNTSKMKGEEINAADVACSFQTEAVGMLVDNAIRAAVDNKMKTIAVAGGVGANGYLRETLLKEGEKRGLKVYFPELKLCTDNAAMIGVAAYYKIKKFGNKAGADFSLDAVPSLKIDDK